MKDNVGESASRLQTGFLALLCLCLAVPLGIFLLIGTYMRYSGDDYCYAATLVQHGFWETQRYTYTNIAYYNGNRFSLNLFSSLADLAGPHANGALPALAISIWLAGLFLVIKRLFETASIKISTLAVLAAAGLLVYATLAKTPAVDQSLFWRSGMLPYLAPLLANSILAFIIIQQVTGQPNPLLRASLAACLAFISAGFSETAGLVQATLLGLALAIGLLLIWRKKSWRQALIRFVGIITACLVPTLAALVIMAISPTVLMMKPDLAQPPDLLLTLRLSMLFTRRFLSTLKTAPLVNFFPAVFTAALVVVALPKPYRGKQIHWVRMAILLVGLAGVTYVLILASMLGFAYAQGAYPEPRAEVIPRFILTIAQAMAGFMAGLVLVSFIHRPRVDSLVVILASLILIASLAYPLWTGRIYWGELPRYQRWVDFWDRRDGEIRQDKAKGIIDIHVMEIDHIIPSVAELSSRPTDLYNQCAAVYYGLNTITADLPGWDE